MLSSQPSEDTSHLKHVLNKPRNHTCASEGCLEQDVALIILIYFWLFTLLADGFVYWHNKCCALPLVAGTRRSCQETRVLVELYGAVWNVAKHCAFTAAVGELMVCDEE